MRPEKIGLRNAREGKNSAFVVTLPEEKVIQEIPAVQIKIDKVEIVAFEDDIVNKKVTAILDKYPHEIILWQDEAYDEIGDWTKSDVRKRIREIFK